MERITVYSTGCPKCEVLKKKLKNKQINFIEFTDTQKMAEMGITTVPQMRIGDGDLLSFKEAVDYINSI